MPRSIDETAEARLCWWCGTANADSGEHKFKRADLTKGFGAGAWSGDNAVAHIANERVTRVNSSRADRLTFERVLCRTCNSLRSRHLDESYDAFADHLLENGTSVLKTGVLDWKAIFGEDWRAGRQNVIGYWVNTSRAGWPTTVCP